ncbi:hypothetical protein PLESTB_000861100 [Pleodorina starrii]|uniref:Uncharacterized protein n=1 Tax=Pleodorina starrii TaxID=330485 RepID=A0A9W6BLQ7_9CHLO|nr:hypothetical protein PLESTM_001432900 [Pleodorina starrii]GLC54414.1 hypothetical protein PLESTB_000861100 [Pleodorina starrii]GLC72066.1 hypothetical protein PLESTF_001200400 [Pleodorina starrii]
MVVTKFCLAKSATSQPSPAPFTADEGGRHAGGSCSAVGSQEVSTPVHGSDPTGSAAIHALTRSLGVGSGRTPSGSCRAAPSVQSLRSPATSVCPPSSGGAASERAAAGAPAGPLKASSAPVGRSSSVGVADEAPDRTFLVVGFSDSSVGPTGEGQGEGAATAAAGCHGAAGCTDRDNSSPVDAGASAAGTSAAAAPPSVLYTSRMQNVAVTYKM